MRPPPESDAELSCATIGAARLAMLRKLIAAGISELIFVELSTEDLGLKFVRVLIPDLQTPPHDHRHQVSQGSASASGACILKVLFAGPRLGRDLPKLRPRAPSLTGPAACGDVARASIQEPTAIDIVDGRSEDRRAVWLPGLQ